MKVVCIKHFKSQALQYELTYGKVSKKGINNLIKYHNEQHQPVIPKYYFSIVNPYLFGGKLNKNC